MRHVSLFWCASTISASCDPLQGELQLSDFRRPFCDHLLALAPPVGVRLAAFFSTQSWYKLAMRIARIDMSGVSLPCKSACALAGISWAAHAFMLE